MQEKHKDEPQNVLNSAHQETGNVSGAIIYIQHKYIQLATVCLTVLNSNVGVRMFLEAKSECVLVHAYTSRYDLTARPRIIVNGHVVVNLKN